jgi:hypothetical protein
MIESIIKTKTANVSAVCCNAESFECDRAFDVVIASGLFPCLDDSKFETMVSNLSKLVAKGGFLLVRSSVGVPSRVDVINQYSEALNCLYTAYYRTSYDMSARLENWFRPASVPIFLYSNHPDTQVVFAPYIRYGLGRNGKSGYKEN